MRTPTKPPREDVKVVARGILEGSESLPVALALWRARHGLRLTDVSAMIGYQPSAVSSMLHSPARVPRVRAAVERLIGYPGTSDGEDG